MSRRLNRYAEKRRHKMKLKKKYGHGLYEGYRTNLRRHEDECRECWGDTRNARNGGYQYWQAYYLTGPRQYAKTCTNRAIRARFRDLLRAMDEEFLEDVIAPHGADYEKEFDYDWCIW